MVVSGMRRRPPPPVQSLDRAKLAAIRILRLGQITAAQEFLVSQNANLFVNSTFGWPALPAQDFRAAVPLIQKPLRGLG